MINAKRVRQDLPRDLLDDATLMKDIATLTEFVPLVTSVTANAVGPLATVMAVAGSVLSAGTRVVRRLRSTRARPAATAAWEPYSKFRVVFYVIVQRSYFEALEEVLKSSRARRSKKRAKNAARRLMSEFLKGAASLDEAELRFHFSIDPASSDIPLYNAYGQWLAPLLREAGLGGRPIMDDIDRQARQRLSAYVSGPSALGRWIASYLALEYERAAVRELRAIRDVLEGWKDKAKQVLREDQRVAWQRYRAHIAHLPDQRGTMFAEDFGVREVFVDPAVTYWRSGVPGQPDRPEEPPSVWQLVGALLSNRTPSEDLIFVCGGPGSGKSTLCRLLASELSVDEDVYPIFVRLRRYKEGAEFAAFLEDVLVKEGLVERLSELLTLPNLVLILDGFDETAMASRAKLRHLFSVLLEDLRSGPLRHARVVISGRDTLFPKGQGFPRGSHVISLQPFDDERIATWGGRWRKLHAGASGEDFYPETLIAGSAEASHSRRIEHLVRWPLTLHLVARTFSSGRLRLDEEDESLAKPFLYRKILAETAERQAEQTQGEGRLMPGEMMEFLRQLAWEMYVRGVDTLEPSDVEPVIARLKRPEGMTLDELAEVAIVNSPELKSGEETGIEFVHKSFAEFLAAELIASRVDEICEELPQRFGRPPEWRYRIEDAARLCSDLVSWRVIPSEVQEMLQPILGWWSEFDHYGSGSQKLEVSTREAQLHLILDRFQDLFRRSDSGADIYVVLGEGAHRSGSAGLARIGSYCAGVVLIGSMAAQELARISPGGGVRFQLEDGSGSFWRWLSAVNLGGPLLDKQLLSRIAPGSSLMGPKGAGLKESENPFSLPAIGAIDGFVPDTSEQITSQLEELVSVAANLLAFLYDVGKIGIEHGRADARREFLWDSLHSATIELEEGAAFGWRFESVVLPGSPAFMKLRSKLDSWELRIRRLHERLHVDLPPGADGDEVLGKTIIAAKKALRWPEEANEPADGRRRRIRGARRRA